MFKQCIHGKDFRFEKEIPHRIMYPTNTTKEKQIPDYNQMLMYNFFTHITF